MNVLVVLLLLLFVTNIHSFVTSMQRLGSFTLSESTISSSKFSAIDSTTGVYIQVSLLNSGSTVITTIDIEDGTELDSIAITIVASYGFYRESSRELYLSGSNVDPAIGLYTIGIDGTISETITNTFPVFPPIGALIYDEVNTRLIVTASFTNILYYLDVDDLTHIGDDAVDKIGGSVAYARQMQITSEDGTDYLYLLVNSPGGLYKFDLNNISSFITYESDTSLTLDPFYVDANTGNIYLSTNNPATISRISSTDLTDIDSITTSARGFSRFQFDEAAGIAYTVTLQDSPTKVVQIRLAAVGSDAWGLQSSFALNSGESRSQTAAINIENRRLFISTNSPTVVEVEYPIQCTSDCSGQGSCSYSVCTCDDPWEGSICNNLPCDPVDCSDQGTCNNGTCACFPGWTDSDCNTFTCPRDCSNIGNETHGTCDLDTNECTCFTDFWTGDDCSVEVISSNRSCPELSANCSFCHENLECIWCESESTCMYGDYDNAYNGPAEGWCPVYFYETCAGSESLIVAIIAYIFLIGFFLINMITAIADDCTFVNADTLDADITRSSFWRSVRSALAYLLLEKYQYIAVVLVTNVPKSTILLQFSLYFSWLVGGIAIFPTNALDVAIEGGNQYSRSIGLTPGMLLLNATVFFAIITAILCLLFIFVVIPAPVGGSEGVMGNRAFYILIRWTQIMYIGLIGLSGFTLNQFFSGVEFAGIEIVSMILAFIFAIVFAILLPLFVMFSLGAFTEQPLISKSDFFNPVIRKKFGGLYEIHNFRIAWLGGVAFLKKGLNALFLGLAGPIVGPILAIICSIIHMIALIILNGGENRPYLDPLSLNFELTNSFVDILLFVVVLLASVINATSMGLFVIGILLLSIVITLIGYILATLRQTLIWAV